VKKLDGRKALGRPRRRWQDNIKIDLPEVAWTASIWLSIKTDSGLL
jgi:hypothetical protein